MQKNRLYALIERVLMNQENRIVGADALELLAELQTMREDTTNAFDHQSKRNLLQIDVPVRGLQFHELHACVDGAKNLDLSDLNTKLTVYYDIDYTDAEGPQLYVQHIVTTDPLTFTGTNCEHTVFAGIDVMCDMCEHRKLAIIEDVEELIVAQEREAA